MRSFVRAHWASRRLCDSVSRLVRKVSSSSSSSSYELALSSDLSHPKLHDLKEDVVWVSNAPRLRSHGQFLGQHWALLPQTLLLGNSRRDFSYCIKLETDILRCSSASINLRYPYSTEREAGWKGSREEDDASREDKSGLGVNASDGSSKEKESGFKDKVDLATGGGSGGNQSGWSKEEVVNWPNAISIARLLSGPLLAWMIVQGLTKPALVGLVLAGASDWLDGYMARRLGIHSVLGSYLDPLADKVLVGCIAVSMTYANLLHPALVALIVARDGVLLVGSFVYRAYALQWQWSGWGEFFKIGEGGVEKVEPLFISKVNMVLQLALIGTALVQPALEIEDTYSCIPILRSKRWVSTVVLALQFMLVLANFGSWSVVATTTLSWIGYAWVYLRRPSRAVIVGGIPHLPPHKHSTPRSKV